MRTGSQLTLVSLFDGIAGFPLAFERAGARVVATVEIDQAAAAVGARHFPDAAQFGDVTKVSGSDLRSAGFVSEHGIVTAGWPCQDFSVAGRRAGLAGARSGLWWEVARILAELRPRWFVGENVPGLLSSVCTPECEGGCMEAHGGAMGAVLGSLAELGYGVAYRVLDAQHFGVPQRRNRVFIVGHLGEPWSASAQVLLEPESGARDSAQGDTQRESVAVLAAIGANTASRPVTHTHTQRFRRCRAAGDAATGSTPNQQQADTSSSRKVVAALTSNGVGTCGADDNQAQAGHLIAPALTARYGKGTDSDATDAIIVHSLAVAGDFSTGEDIAQTIRSAHGQPGVVSHDTVVRRLTELECERLQGYPDGWTDGQSGSTRYRQLGNSVAVPVVEWIARRLLAVDQELP